jgi:hypothetical protein
MITGRANNLAAPYDLTALYWLTLGADRAGRNSLSSFFFASPDGSTLVKALNDIPRFLTALAAAIAALPAGAGCASDLVALYADLQAVPVPVIWQPTYPAVGDTGVIGTVVAVNALQRTIDGVTNVTLYCGIVSIDLAANDFDTPPADFTGFPLGTLFLGFKTTNVVTKGQRVTYDITQGNFAAQASNVQGA